MTDNPFRFIKGNFLNVPPIWSFYVSLQVEKRWYYNVSYNLYVPSGVFAYISSLIRSVCSHPFFFRLYSIIIIKILQVIEILLSVLKDHNIWLLNNKNSYLLCHFKWKPQYYFTVLALPSKSFLFLFI